MSRNTVGHPLKWKSTSSIAGADLGGGCRGRGRVQRDSVDYKNTHAVNEHVTPVNSFLKISLSCYVKINVQVKREKLVTCRHTQTTNSPISLSQKNDWSWGILSATPVTAGCFNKFVVVVKAQGVKWETEGLPVEKRKTAQLSQTWKIHYY